MKRYFFLILVATIIFSGVNTPCSATSNPISPHWKFTVDAELNSPLVGSLAGGTDLFNTVAVAARLGAHKNRIGVFAFGEYGRFKEPSYNIQVSNTLLSIGGGGTLGYFKNRLLAMVQIGATILLTESFQNPKNTVGMFTEIRPAGFYFPFKRINLQIYPITLSWIMPVLQNVPLFYIHYRTAISIGGTF